MKRRSLKCACACLTVAVALRNSALLWSSFPAISVTRTPSATSLPRQTTCTMEENVTCLSRPLIWPAFWSLQKQWFLWYRTGVVMMSIRPLLHPIRAWTPKGSLAFSEIIRRNQLAGIVWKPFSSSVPFKWRRVLTVKGRGKVLLHLQWCGRRLHRKLGLSVATRPLGGAVPRSWRWRVSASSTSRLDGEGAGRCFVTASDW